MEWVETTARTVEEAKELALDQLGVAEDDAELIVLDEPKAGLFGRVRGEARVRARVRPTQARQKLDRRDRRKKKGDETESSADSESSTAEPAGAAAVAPADNGAAPARSPRPPARTAARATARAEAAAPATTGESGEPGASTNGVERPVVSAAAVGEQARQFVDDLVRAFGLSGTTALVEDGDDLEVQVEGTDLGLLVGPRGATLQAVQDLARVASQRRLGDHDTRLRVDVGGYRVRRREALGRFALQVADEVRSTGTARALEPMSSADRKIIHEALADHEGVTTRSEGDDPTRRVIIDPSVG